MAESLFAASVRDQLFERVADDGAAPLYVRLLEEGGVAMQPEPGMEEMAAWLDSRKLLVQSAAGVALPGELVVLEQGRSEMERGWSLTLLARCDERSLRALAEAAGLPHRSRRVELVLSLQQWLVAAPVAGMEELGAATLSRLPLPVSEIRRAAVSGVGGNAQFELDTKAGPIVVAAREVALAVAKKPAKAKRPAVERVSRFEFPPHGVTGALVSVTSRALADRIAAEERLAGYLGQRLDGRRFVAAEEVTAEELEARLAEALPGVEVLHG